MQHCRTKQRSCARDGHPMSLRIRTQKAAKGTARTARTLGAWSYPARAPLAIWTRMIFIAPSCLLASSRFADDSLIACQLPNALSLEHTPGVSDARVLHAARFACRHADHRCDSGCAAAHCLCRRAGYLHRSSDARVDTHSERGYTNCANYANCADHGLHPMPDIA
jgi:hypothetical protein